MSARSRPWLAFAVLWTAAILAVNSLSVSDPGWRPPFPGADKVTHFVMYAVAAFAWRRAFTAAAAAVTWRVLAGVLALAALDEWHQLFVPGRSAELADWVADGLGAALGILLWHRVSVNRPATA